MQMILSRSSDTLWDVAAAEVRSRENRTDEEDAEEDAHFLTQRTVFFMGSKAGVRLQYITLNSHILFMVLRMYVLMENR